MSIAGLIIVAALVVFVALLRRAAHVIGRNPYQQIKIHEDIAGRFPDNMSMTEKLHLIDFFGLSPSNPGRIWGLVLAVVALFGFLLWQA
mgnify:CR=1 FL=1